MSNLSLLIQNREAVIITKVKDKYQIVDEQRHRIHKLPFASKESAIEFCQKYGLNLKMHK